MFSFALQNYWVKLLNLLFSVLVVFHLTYLGSMFDPGADEQEVEEVSFGTDLNFSPECVNGCPRLWFCGLLP